MKVTAPGKLLLTGAYAVLEGAPAIVVAIDRGAIADGSRVDTSPSAEVRAALGDAPAPVVDVTALHDDGTKLGLGSSAASLVATLGLRAVERGESLADPTVRVRIFAAAREAHARVQGGGSGFDVAASVHGGVLRYQLRGASADCRAITLPEGLVVSCFWSGASARTSDLRARVDALRTRDASAHRALFVTLTTAATHAANACDGRDVHAFLDGARAFASALAALGVAADAPIVPPAFAALDARANDERAVFMPSGAGGGDVAVHLAARPPTESFFAHARAAGMRHLPFVVDREGVRVI